MQSGVLRNFVNAVVSQKISFFGKCIKILWIIYKKLKSVSLKWSSLFKYFYSLCEKNEVWLYYENAVVTDKIPFFWKWFKILWRIHEKLTCVFLNEKNSIQHFNSLFEVNGVLNYFLKVVISEKSLCFVSALRFYEAFPRNPHAFLWIRSRVFIHFNLLCKLNGVLHYL